MPDQMPLGGGAADLDYLALGFLYLVLAQDRGPGGNGFTQSCGGVRLADGDEFYITRGAARSECGLFDPPVNGF